MVHPRGDESIVALFRGWCVGLRWAGAGATLSQPVEQSVFGRGADDSVLGFGQSSCGLEEFDGVFGSSSEGAVRGAYLFEP